MAVGAQHVGELVGRVLNVDLDPIESTVEVAPKEIRPFQLGSSRVDRSARCELQLKQLLGLPLHEVMVVVAGQEHEPLALEFLPQQPE